MGPEINVDELLKGFQAKYVKTDSGMQNPIADAEIEDLGAKFNGIAEGAANVDDVVFETNTKKAEEPGKEYAAQRDALTKKVKNAAEEIKNYLKGCSDLSKPTDIDKLNELIKNYTGENLKKFVLDGITDEKLKKEAENYIKKLEKTDPAKYDDMKHPSTATGEILGLYQNVRDLYAIQLLDYLNNNPTNNITALTETVQQGFYYGNRIDKDSKEGKEIAAKIESGELTGKDVKQTEDGSYYRLIKIGHQYGSKDNFEKYALKKYKETFMSGQMFSQMLSALNQLSTKKKLDEYKTDAELIEDIKKELNITNGSDREFEAFIKKNTNVKEIFERRQKVMARRKELQHVTWRYINDNLSQEVIWALKDYINQNRRKDENGNYLDDYDLSGLSALIEERSGKDFFVNTQEDINLDERESIKKGLRGKGFVKLDFFDEPGKPEYKLTKELIDFCGYKVQKRNHMPTVLEAALGLINGGASTAVGFLTSVPQSREIVYHHILDVNQNVIINTPTGTTTIQNLYYDVIHRVITIDEWENIFCAIRNGSLTGLGLAIVVDAAIGRPVNEKSCNGVEVDFNSDDETYSNPTNYKKYLAANKLLDKTEEARIDAAVAAAEKPGETRPWHEIYRNNNVSDSGHGLLNCEERIMSNLPSDKKVEPKPEQQAPIIRVKEHIPAQTTTVDYEHIEAKTTKYTSEDGIGAATWSHLADNVYGCEGAKLKDLYPNLQDRTLILKFAQCITDENYSKERMDTLLDAFHKNKYSLKDSSKYPYFDANVFYDHDGIKGVWLAPEFPKELKKDKDGNIVMRNGKPVMQYAVKLPENLAGVERCPDLTRDKFNANYTGDKVSDVVTSSYFRYEKGSKTIETAPARDVEHVGRPGQGYETFETDAEGTAAEKANKKVDALYEETPNATYRIYDDEHIDDFKEAAKKKEPEEKENK